MAAAHVLPLAFRLGVALAGRRSPEPALAPAAGMPPVYTVLGPLHDEPGRVGPWLDAVAALEYPRDRLDVCLLLEADDRPTLAAAAAEARRRGDPAWLRVLVVPPRGPRTKPNALMHGLRQARGALLVVYDAEDAPDPDQLRRAAAAFAAGPGDLACLQARPVVVPRRGDRLGRLMAADYDLWHGRFLPGLARIGAPVPLAGTSNHFVVDALRAVGGWDPRNLTEDAELGLRIARAGLSTRMLASATREDGTPPGTAAWVRQRSRWAQGFAQTWWAAARPPGALVRDLGAVRAACAHMTLAGTLAVQLTTPPLWAGAAGGLVRALARRRPPGAAALACAGALMAAGAARGAVSRAAGAPAPAGAGAPGARLLEGIAAWRGMYGLVRHPLRWEKTAHPRTQVAPAPGARPGSIPAGGATAAR